MRLRMACLAAGLIGLLLPPAGSLADEALREEARAAMRRAATYFRAQVAVGGGYVYHVTPDLAKRWGEGLAGPREIWVQPPGTPTVGLALLTAWRATGDELYLQAADEAGEALMHGQLVSGGWTQTVDFDRAGPRVARYRNGKGSDVGRNSSTLDDGISQGAIRFLMHLDEAHAFKNEPVHDACEVALTALLQAQYTSGAFPQVWIAPVAHQPVLQASYPAYDWRTQGRIKNYWDMYTLNDGLAGTVTQTLLDADRIYGDPKYKAALARLGDFLILAQMPAPQPAWAQQYSYAMHPIWARRFEPAAVTGGESQDVLESLLAIHRATGEGKYLRPIPAALAYLNKSLLPDGRLARYYELQTNKPLYMTRSGGEYTLTYDDANLPDHYGWKVASRLEAIEAAYKGQGAGAREQEPRPTDNTVRKIIASLDDQSRWVSTYAGERLVGQPKFKPGDKYVSSAVFRKNLEQLSAYVAAQ